MKIGIVESLNARPLTWGIEQNPCIQKVYSNPRQLSELLLQGELDAALISSVEVLRNKSRLGYSQSCGVCSRNLVRSILFFQNLRENFPSSPYPVDNGSRTSVALLQLLHAWEYGFVPEVIPRDPSWIREKIRRGEGSHLLFGDNALLAEYNTRIYEPKDLARWWYDTTGLYFLFALWAYPVESAIPDSFFVESLEAGLDSIEAIIRQEIEKKKPRLGPDFIRTYLTQDLHYYPEEKNWEGFRLFEEELEKWKIL